MFIVFEGIDGSGKTTISNRVSERLRTSGLAVTHVREEGTFTSSAAQAIRELGRDARNLMLSPLAELMLYVARDGQSLDEMVLPALGAADVVIADRFLYSAELLATAGRGLAAETVAAIVGPVAARLSPDIAILIDVPPDLARARRRVSKLVTPDDLAPSRKGLAGAGLQVRLRAAHRRLAEEHPETWLIVDNQDADLEEIVDSLVAAITTAVRAGAAAGLAEGRRRLPSPRLMFPRGIASAAEAREALLTWVDRRAAREPGLAAYVLGGLIGADIDARRRLLAEHAPQVVARTLAGRDDLVAWRMRAALVDRAPEAVARSLGGLTGEGPERWRHALVDRAPTAVAASLAGLDDDDSWALRDRLYAGHPDAILASLAGVSSTRADAMRVAWLAVQPSGASMSYPHARAAAHMVNGRGDDLAWQVRDLVFAAAPVEAISSLKGDRSPRAWEWRARFAERAPRPVMESLQGIDDPRAWRMRAVLAARCKEVFDSMIGLDGAEAWMLRDRHADTWPSTVCKSLGTLAATPRGKALVTAILSAHPGLSLLRNVAKTLPVALPEAAGDAPVARDTSRPRGVVSHRVSVSG